MFNSVQAQQAVLKLNASQKSMMHLMSVIINGISVFVAIILGFLIVYANQFLMKRRHKEMGNLSVVRNGKTTGIKDSSDRDFIDRCFGIDRRIGFRCVFITRTCDVDSKDVCGSDERVSVCFLQTAFIQTILYFAIIFIIVMIFNGITISKYKLINLLNSAKKNQKARLKNPILSVILFFDIHWNSWSSISFNPKKTRCLLWTMTLRSA